jgi:O-antigen/teichoic acid export membrane protein
VDRLSTLVARVIPSILSRGQHDRAELRRSLLGLSEGVAFVALPLAVGMALTADDFVRIAAGPAWAGAVMPLRLLAFYGGFRAIATVISPVLVATGHAKRDLQYTLFSLLVLAPAFVLGARWGTTGVAAAWIVAFPIASFPSYRAVFKIVDLHPIAYVRTLWPPIAACVVMSLMVLAVRAAAPATLPIGLRFAAQVAVGAIAYAGVIRLRYWSRVQTFLALVRSGDSAEASEAEAIAAAAPESGIVSA